MTNFGWGYPPGVTGNEPEIAGYEEDNPACPDCGSEYTFEDGDWFVCDECGYEW